MTRHRSLADRIMPLIRPSLVEGFAPPPFLLAEGFWLLERRYRMPGGPVLPSRSSIVRLESGGLLVISPPPVEAGGLEALDALGRVEDVLVPNAYHHLNTAAFLARHPDAKLWLSPGLRERVPELPPAAEVDAAASWSTTLEHAVLAASSAVSETALFHRASATLILTDLAFHMTRFERTFDRLAWRLSGVPSGFGPSRTARTLLLNDRQLAGRFLRNLLDWPFARIVVAHGEVLEDDARETFRRAYGPWLAA